ncbi:hypothetical protein [Pseudomonas sp. KNUC1026]|uniref:hypothetical protein n=1 Tax=Pseudomonas sp. KNUC1026 TaxID=2893890 RepID=UPI001F35883F|nr:hypothetical protein [Pseudomonas sp. KNUC1026]UFH48873.1 hypothetical protein LN139_18140 [Pseudomonas sp. KNUC1026]
MDNSLKKALKAFLSAGSLEKMQDQSLITALRENDIIIPSIDMSHDELLDKLHHQINLTIKKRVVDSFLFGLEHGRAEYRAALPAFAIASKLPHHSFESNDAVQCDICGGFKTRSMNFTLYNIMRYVDGATNSGAPEQLYIFLKKHNESEIKEAVSLSAFSELLMLLRNLSDDDTLMTLERKMRSLSSCKLTKNEARGLIDLLGHLSVLESPEHKGFLSGFKNIGTMPRKSRSSEWSYPADFWKGQFGVNEAALKFWFEEYL